MTVPATTRRAGPFNGNGVTTSFPFTFKVFSGDSLRVVRATNGVETALVLDSDYSVTLNGDQDASPGGSITYPLSGDPLATGETLTAVGNEPYTQELDLPAGGAFSPRALENALDRTTFQIQQLAEATGRSLTLPVSAASADTALPAPVANNVIGWDEAASTLVNYSPADLATVVVAGTSYTDVFSGNGVQTVFTLTANPGSVNALDIAISGVSQVNGVDFTVSGATLTFTNAPPLGAGNVCVRYVAALPVGTTDAQDVTFDPTAAYPAGTTGWGVRVANRGINVLRYVPPAQWAAALAGTSTDDHTAALQAAINAASNSMEREVFFPAGKWNYTRLYAYYDAVLNPGFNINRNAEVWLNGAGYSPENGGNCGSILNCTSATGDGFVVSPASEDALPYRGRDFRATGISFHGNTTGFVVVCKGVPSATFDNCEIVQANINGSALDISTAYFGGLDYVRIRNTGAGTKTGTAIRFGTTIDGGLFQITNRSNVGGFATALLASSGSWQNMTIQDSQLTGSTYGIRVAGSVSIQQLNLIGVYFEGPSVTLVSDDGANKIRCLAAVGCWVFGGNISGPLFDLQAPNSVQFVGGYAQDVNTTFLNIAALPSGGRGGYSVSGLNLSRSGAAPAPVTLFTGVLPSLEGVDWPVSDPNVTLYAKTATSAFPLETFAHVGNAQQSVFGGIGVGWVRNYSVGGGEIINQGNDNFPRAIVVTQTAGATVRLAEATTLPHGTLTFVKNAAGSTGNLTVQRNGGTTLGTLAPGASGWFLLDRRTANDWV